MRDVLIALIAAAALQGAAVAQAIAPMSEDFAVWGEHFAIHLAARNPYGSAERFSIVVYGADWARFNEASAQPQSVKIAAGGEARFTVYGRMRGPFVIFRVCVRSEPKRAGGTVVRGEACGKYRIIQRQR